MGESPVYLAISPNVERVRTENMCQSTPFVISSSVRRNCVLSLLIRLHFCYHEIYFVPCIDRGRFLLSISTT